MPIQNYCCKALCVTIGANNLNIVAVLIYILLWKINACMCMLQILMSMHTQCVLVGMLRLGARLGSS